MAHAHCLDVHLPSRRSARRLDQQIGDPLESADDDHGALSPVLLDDLNRAMNARTVTERRTTELHHLHPPVCHDADRIPPLEHRGGVLRSDRSVVPSPSALRLSGRYHAGHGDSEHERERALTRRSDL